MLHNTSAHALPGMYALTLRHRTSMLQLTTSIFCSYILLQTLKASDFHKKEVLKCYNRTNGLAVPQFLSIFVSY